MTLLITHIQCCTEYSPQTLNNHSHLGSPSPSNPHEGLYKDTFSILTAFDLALDIPASSLVFQMLTAHIL